MPRYSRAERGTASVSRRTNRAGAPGRTPAPTGGRLKTGDPGAGASSKVAGTGRRARRGHDPRNELHNASELSSRRGTYGGLNRDEGFSLLAWCWSGSRASSGQRTGVHSRVVMARGRIELPTPRFSVGQGLCGCLRLLAGFRWLMRVRAWLAASVLLLVAGRMLPIGCPPLDGD
jgi:hypothetical protein